MHRRYQVRLDSTGTGRVDISPDITAVEWDVYQVSVQTNPIRSGCIAAMYFNDAYIHHTMFGSQDSASGAPNTVLNPQDIFTVVWTGGTAQAQATVSIWYSENPVGTSPRPG